MDGEKRHLALAGAIVEKARKMGADVAEAYLLHARELSIEVSEGQVETLKLAEDQGVGIRVFRDSRMGFAYSSSLEERALEKVIQQAVANSALSEKDEFLTMPQGGFTYPSLDIFDPGITQVAVEDKVELAKEIESIARARDSRVKITEAASYSDSEYEVFVANSQGIQASYRAANCGAYAFMVAEENGDSQNGLGLQYGLHYGELNPAQIGTEAADNALRMLGARTIPTQRATIVLDNRVANGFLGLLAPALSSDAVQKGKSLLAGKMGTAVTAKNITIIDNGRLEGAVMSAPFDGEGVATAENILIDSGVLSGYMYNTYTAARDGVKSTGNGKRGSFKGTPEVGTTNFYIKAGEITREQLFNGVETGLFITEVMGMHTANPITGDFSVGVAGLWIEKGQPVYPVRGITLAGNLLDMFSRVEAVASDLRFLGSKGSPTIRLAPMMLSGN
ncbi:MAG TPA: TldD/PmbA family protein [Bacillota bacterium]|nr:TldD/PmbA family protein [Bacillota bacterium]